MHITTVYQSQTSAILQNINSPLSQIPHSIISRTETHFLWPSLITYLPLPILTGFSIRIWVGGKILGVGGEWNTRAEGVRSKGGLGVFSLGKFRKFGSVFEQNRKHKSPLKLLRILARFFCFSWINLGRSRARFFVANVSHVIRKLWGNSSIK